LAAKSDKRNRKRGWLAKAGTTLREYPEGENTQESYVLGFSLNN